MDFKKNLKYFQSNDKHFNIGICVLGLGLVLFALTFLVRRAGFFLMTPALTFIAVGAAIAFVPLSYRSSGSELDEDIARKIEKYEEITADETGLSDSLLRMLKSTVVGDYTYDDGVLFRRERTDRRMRTSIYTATALIFTKTGIFTAQKKISLIEDTETETTADYVYEELDSVSTVTEEKMFEDGTRSMLSFIVITADGKEIARIPTERVSAADRLCDEINHVIENVKTGRPI
jgi:hypothetical protein